MKQGAKRPLKTSEYPPIEENDDINNIANPLLNSWKAKGNLKSVLVHAVNLVG